MDLSKTNIVKILSIPKSLYVCLRLLPMRQAIRLPLLVRYNTALKRLSGRVDIDDKYARHRTVQIGFEENGLFDGKTDRCVLDIAGTLRIDGTAILGKGTRISINKDGVLCFGNNFYNSAKIEIVCFKYIRFGENCVTSWDTLIMDSDLHTTRNTLTDIINECDRIVEIGDNVWISARVTVLKGCRIANGCIIGANSLVMGTFNMENTLIAGVPASVKKNNITLNTVREA